MENKVIGHSGALEDRRLKLIRVFSKPVWISTARFHATVPDPGITRKTTWTTSQQVTRYCNFQLPAFRPVDAHKGVGYWAANMGKSKTVTPPIMATSMGAIRWQLCWQLPKRRRARRWIWGPSSRIRVCFGAYVAQTEIWQLLTRLLALGSWADEMEDMPMPCT